MALPAAFYYYWNDTAMHILDEPLCQGGVSGSRLAHARAKEKKKSINILITGRGLSIAGEVPKLL
jgi:hypothetical protein